MADITFIGDLNDYENYSKLTPKNLYKRNKVNFICSKCGELKTKSFQYLTKDFICTSCSISKTVSSSNFQEKIKNTCIAKYGKEHYLQSDEAKIKSKESCMNKYGVEHPSKSNEVKNKKKKTLVDKYGVDNPSKIDLVKEAKKKTCNEHFGVDCPTQSNVVMSKIKATLKEKYGVDNLSNIPNWKEKCDITRDMKYGDKNYRNYEQAMKTRIEKYGEEAKFFANKDKINETNLLKYGSIWLTQTEHFKQKAKATNLKRYGVEYAAQSPEVAKRKKHKYYYNSMGFDSNTEIEVFKFCEKHNLSVELYPIKIKYIDSLGIKHNYIPDFRINGKLYEVKGDLYLDENYNLINPYKNTGTEESRYAIDCKLKAKTECMKKNGVVIIPSSKIQELEKIIIF